MTNAPVASSGCLDAVDEIVRQWATVRPELDVAAIEVFGRLHRSFLLYRSGISAMFAEVGTNEPGFDVLAALRRSGPERRVSAGALARQTLVTTGGLSLRLKRLEAEGYVRRERDPDDQRMVYVSLTEAGRELVDRAADEERTDLARLLGRLYEVLQESPRGVGLEATEM
jgi:DNA-binding MarR family transcriptional regulator